VIEQMKQRGWTLGGENSGHIICGEVSTTGDAIISALQVLLALSSANCSLNELKQGMRKLPQIMINVRHSGKATIVGNAKVEKAVAAVEKELADTGRVLLRASGTEPLIRVMVEGEDLSLVNKLAEQLSKVVELELQ
jgi:phosphoglucosamine mutase